MEATLSHAKMMPLSDKCLVEKEEMLFLVRMVREGLPDELRQARWLLDQNRQLIAEARKEADSIMRDAQAQMARMIDEHEITIKAREEATDLIEDATRQSTDIRNSAIKYTHDILTDLEDQLAEILTFVTRNKKELE
jgi:vacuolar-type H+-ATPase subunit H